MKLLKSFKTIGRVLILATAFALGIFGYQRYDSQRQLAGLDRNLRLGFQSVIAHAADVPSRWGLVKQSVTWGQANTNILRVLVEPIVNSGILKRGTTFTQTSEDSLWTWRITPNANESHTSTAYSGSVTFTHKFEVWRASDNQKALELFFTTPDNLAEASLLLLYRLKIMNAVEFNGDDTVTESFTFGSADARKQTYTLTGGSPKTDMGGVDRLRVIIEEMDSGTIICVKSIVRLRPSTIDLCGTASTADYYSLAYSQNLTGDKEVTAKFGLVEGAIDGTGLLCSPTTNVFNYGLFSESQSFISDGNASGAIPSTHPAASRVDALFAELGTAGDGEFDDTRFATVEGWNLAMKSLAAP